MKKKRVSLLSFVLILSLLIPSISYADVTSNYQNPLMKGADPTIVRAADGYYYSCFAVNNDIYLKKAETILGVSTAKSIMVWARPTDNAEFGYVWGPYIYRLDGKWYIYFTSGQENSYGYGHPNSYVLENISPDPFEGSWELKGQFGNNPKGMMNTEGNGLACGVVTLGGKRYFTYTKYFWNGTENGPNPKFDECPTIVAMENPWTLTGTEGTLARPQYDWEKHGDSINEGAAVVERNGKTYFAYSVSSFMNDNYGIGLSTANSSADLLDSNSWTKHPVPLMSKSPENTAFGPGSPLFVKSEDGTEDWLIYHAGPVGGQTGSNRWVRAQRINWNDDGFINIGLASNPSTVLNRPSGEEKSETYEAEDASFGGVTRTILGDSSKSSGSGVMQYNNGSGDYVEFVVNTNSAGSYSLDFRYNNNTSSSIPMNLEVNGGNRGLSFWSNEGDEFNYDLLKVENVHLQEGSNIIRLSAAEAKGLVLDALIIKRSVKYEAEDAVLSGGAAKANNHTGYSGTGFVEGMWNKGASAQFTVEAPYAGNYSVNLRYCNGFTVDKTLSIYVNGVRVKQIDLFSYGDWDKWAERYDNLPLKAGSNTITYKYDEGDSGDVNLDSISVTEATTWHYEAEDGVVSGNAAIAADKSGYTGTGFVTGLTSVTTASVLMVASDTTTASVITIASDTIIAGDTAAASDTIIASDTTAASDTTIASNTTTASIITTAIDTSAVNFSVNVENSAAYDFKLIFSNGDAESKTLSLYLNGAKVKQMSFPSTGNWNTWSEVLETVNLNKGNNTIAFKCDAEDSGNINIDNIHLNKRTPVKYQAEDAIMLGGSHPDTNHLWYEGTGFVGGFESDDESIKFNVNVPNTVSYTTTLRYSGAQSSNITMSLYVNGQKIKQVSLPPTANWDSWAEATETVNLNAGNNTIEYKRDKGDTGKFNIDSITIDKFSGGNTRLNNSGLVSGTVYKIISKRSGKALDVVGYSRDPGALIDQWSYVGGNNQRWEMIDDGDGYYKIKSAFSGLVIDIVDGSEEDMLCQTTSVEKDSQKWRLEKVGKYYKIINKSNGKVFDVSNESFNNGASVHLWEYLGNDNQLWTIETPSAVERFQEATEITDVPTTATAGEDLTLHGIVAPDNATNQNIVWSVKDAGSTEAAIRGNVFSAKKAGTAIITATVIEGIEDGTDLTQEFVITVDASHPVITPPSANYDLNAPGDVSTDITWNRASAVTDVAYGLDHLTMDNGYVLTGGTLTIKSDYLASLEPKKGEKVEFEIFFDKGNPATFTVSFIDGSEPQPISYGITVENDGSGTAEANATSAAENTEITLTVAPKTDYHFKEWQVISPTGLAINGNTFIMPNTAVTVRAIFEKNQVENNVTALTVAGKDGVTSITTKGGTLQMVATVTPSHATNKAVTWSIVSGDDYASLSDEGLLKAKANGTVTVKATSVSDTSVSNTCNIVISGNETETPNVAVTAVTVAGKNGATSITTKGGTLQMVASVSPSNATNKAVTWSIESGSDYASISAEGILTAKANGTVKVKATSVSNLSVSNSCEIVISVKSGSDSGSGRGNSRPSATIPAVNPPVPNPNTTDTPKTEPVKVSVSLTTGEASSEGTSMTLTVKPYVENGRTMAGVRDVAGMLQVEQKHVVWNAKDKSIVINSQGILIKLVIGQKYAIVNGQKVALDVAPQVKDGRTVLPVAQIARLLNIETQFDAKTKEITFIIKK